MTLLDDSESLYEHHIGTASEDDCPNKFVPSLAYEEGDGVCPIISSSDNHDKNENNKKTYGYDYADHDFVAYSRLMHPHIVSRRMADHLLMTPAENYWGNSRAADKIKNVVSGDDGISTKNHMEKYGYRYVVPDSATGIHAERPQNGLTSNYLSQAKLGKKCLDGEADAPFTEENIGHGGACPYTVSNSENYGVKMDENKYSCGLGYANPDCSKDSHMHEPRNFQKAKDQPPRYPVRRMSKTLLQRNTIDLECNCAKVFEAPHVASTKRRPKSISFAQTNNVKEVERLTTLVDTPEDLWFQRQDYDRFRENIHTVFDKTKKGNTTRRYCLRGLESYFECPTAKRQAKECILRSQCSGRRWSTDGINYDDLSKLSMFNSLKSKEQAVQRAAEDETSIRNYLKNSGHTMSRPPTVYFCRLGSKIFRN